MYPFPGGYIFGCFLKNAPSDGLSMMAKFPRLHEELVVLPDIVWRRGM